MFARCPRNWYLGYALKKRSLMPSIHTVFGTSFHETFQHYLQVCFQETVKQADAIDLNKYLLDRMIANYQAEIGKDYVEEHFTDALALTEIWNDGCHILDWIKKRRAAYFSTKKEVFLGTEIPLFIPVADKYGNVYIVAYLDLIMYDKTFNRVRIIDIKTSTYGWRKYQKEDPIKKAQVILYKHYFSEVFDVPLENIEVEFFIVKRKLYEDLPYAQKRVQLFTPAQGKITMNKTLNALHSFIEYCFNEDGSYNLNQEYHAISGTKEHNCKFCEFKDNEELCPVSKRIESLPDKNRND